MVTGGDTGEDQGEEGVDIDAPDLMLATLLQRWPSCAQAFWQQKMQCPGCPFSRFHTVKHACGEFNVDETQFRADLHATKDLDRD